MKVGKGSGVAALAYAAALWAFDDSMMPAEACSCPEDGSLCEAFVDADVVLHAKALSRTQESSASDMSMFADVTYTVEVIDTYKGEDGEVYGSQISFVTSASSSFCGIYLDVGQDGEDDGGREYLVDLHRHESSGELRAVGPCGVFKEWSDEDEFALEGCAPTPAPGRSSTQEIQAESGDTDSSAERLVVQRGLLTAGTVALCYLCSLVVF